MPSPEIPTSLAIWLGEGGQTPAFSGNRMPVPVTFMLWNLTFALTISSYTLMVSQHKQSDHQLSGATADKRITVIWDTLHTDKGPECQELSFQTIGAVPSLPNCPYLPLIHPIGRLASWHQYYPQPGPLPHVKAFARNATLLPREPFPVRMQKRDIVSDNFPQTQPELSGLGNRRG